MKQVTAIMIGAGARGTTAYTSYALENPNEIKIVGVAEPNQVRRENFKKLHNIPNENCFCTWEEILEHPQFADAAFICTQDNLHYAPAMKALDQGYHLLLEKPIATTLQECLAIRDKANEVNRHAIVCHVLRYTDFFKELKQIILAGRIGEIVSLVHCENVYHIHHSHSYVRGPWKDSQKSTPMILSKSSHDLDIIQWLISDVCTDISSFGSLKYFCQKNAPEGATPFCLDGCPHLKTCTYSAPRIYVKDHLWPTYQFHDGPNTPEAVLETLRTSDYGKCVFKSDNDVVDHQVVNLTFQNGATASFTMCAFTHDATRTMKFMGTLGEIRVLFGDELIIEIYDFRTNKKEVIYPSRNSSGHGGGDFNLMSDFVTLMATGQKSICLTSIDDSVQSHLLAFAAEHSRLTNATVHLKDFAK